MASNAMVRQLLLSPAVQTLDDETVVELICQAEPTTLDRLSPSIRIDGTTALRLARKGYQFACAAAEHTDDEGALGRLAKNSSVQVRRKVAANTALAPETVDYLWRWALDHDDFDVLTNLAGRRSAESVMSECVLANIATGRASNTIAHLIAHLLEEGGDNAHAKMLGLADSLLDDETGGTAARTLTEVVVVHLLNNGENIPDQLSQIASGIARRPDVTKTFLSLVAQKGPITTPVEQLLGDAGFTGAISDRVTVDDETVIRLLETAPERLTNFSATSVYRRDGSHARLAEYLLANAKKYPYRAYQVINGHLVDLAELDPTLVEQAIRDLPYEEVGQTGAIDVRMLFFHEYQWASDVVVKILQHRDTLPYYTKDPFVTWLTGEYEHQQPTHDELAAVFANPGNALRMRGLYGSAGSSDVKGFVHYLAKEGSLSAETFAAFGDVIFAGADDDWKHLLGFPPAAEYAATQLATRVGLTSENIRVVLAMLANSQVGFETTLQSIALMYPPSEHQQEPSNDETAILGLQMSLI